MSKFYKIARPDGWDFYTGRTINYRDNIGKTVKRPNKGKIQLCSNTAIHASRDPNQCFVGGEIPCSLYLVEGKPYAEDGNKCGFKQLRVLKELRPEKVFKWRYEEVCNPVHPFKIKPPKVITKEHLELLKQWDLVGDSVKDSVKDSVGDSIGISVWYSVWNSVWYSVKDSVRDSIGISVWYSVMDSVRDSVRDSVKDSVWDSVWDSVGAYVGYLFTSVVEKWKYINHKKGEYPFQPAVDLWMQGLVPVFDGKKWRLHGGEDADVLWEGEVMG